MTPAGSDTKPDLDATLKNLKLSNDEVDKFAKAFKDPEFIKLFEEYAKEISDPTTKAETDLYLRQLENEGRAEDVYGKGVLLVVPTEAFVIKTSDTKSGQKAFVNVCTSEKLEKLSMQPTKGPSGKAGRHVEIPLSLSNKKTGEDKAGKPCCVWDFVVHPETVAVALGNPQIKQLLIETAFEQIKGAHGFELSPQYKVLNIKYKGTPDAPKPHVLSVRTKGGDVQPGARLQPRADVPVVTGLSGATSAAGALQPPTPQEQDTSSKRSAFKFPNAKQSKKSPSDSLGPEQPGFVHATGEATPQWEIIHRGQVDLGECWGDARAGLSLPPPTYPQHLVLKVSLPGCTSAAALQLDISTRLASVVLPGKYKLEVPLPFGVRDEEGKAKFDKVKQVLEVTLPTVPPPRLPAPPRQATPLLQEMPSTGDDAVDEQEQEQEGVVGQEQEGVGSNAGGDVQDDADDVCGRDGTAGEGSGSCTRDATGSGHAAELTDNQRRWMEMHAQQQKEAEQQAQLELAERQAKEQEAITSGTGTDACCEGEEWSGEFVAREAWVGARPGYVFKRGALGVGYYHDRKPQVHGVSGKAPQGSQAVLLKPRLTSSLADELD